MNITDEDMAKALDRIARTPDGQLLYLSLQKVLMGIAMTSDPGALQMHHGRRSLAAELMARMSTGIEQSAGTGSTNRPVVIARTGGVSVSRSPRGAGRRITADTDVPGWKRPGDTGD